MFVARTAYGPGHPVELGEELALGLELLDDRLDHEGAVREVGDFGGERQPGGRLVALHPPLALLLGGAAEVVAAFARPGTASSMVS